MRRVGLAVGRANITRSARVFGHGNRCRATPTPCVPSRCVPFDFSTSEAKNAHFIYGWSAGVGVDVMLMPNFFVRAEFEYIGFTEAQGIQAQIGTARVGAGFKF